MSNMSYEYDASNIDANDTSNSKYTNANDNDNNSNSNSSNSNGSNPYMTYIDDNTFVQVDYATVYSLKMQQYRKLGMKIETIYYPESWNVKDDTLQQLQMLQLSGYCIQSVNDNKIIFCISLPYSIFGNTSYAQQVAISFKHWISRICYADKSQEEYENIIKNNKSAVVVKYKIRKGEAWTRYNAQHMDDMYKLMRTMTNELDEEKTLELTKKLHDYLKRMKDILGLKITDDLSKVNWNHISDEQYMKIVEIYQEMSEDLGMEELS